MNRKSFGVNNLKSGYVVELRNGSRFIVTRVMQTSFTKVLVNKTDYIPVVFYDNQLRCYSDCRDESKDIVKVWGLSADPMSALCISEVNNRPLLWESLFKRLTKAEIEKIVGFPIEIVEEA